MYNIPAKNPKSKNHQTPFRSNNGLNIKRSSIRRPPITLKDSAYLKGNPVTSVTLPYTLPAIRKGRN